MATILNTPVASPDCTLGSVLKDVKFDFMATVEFDPWKLAEALQRETDCVFYGSSPLPQTMTHFHNGQNVVLLLNDTHIRSYKPRKKIETDEWREASGRATLDEVMKECVRRLLADNETDLCRATAKNMIRQKQRSKVQRAFCEMDFTKKKEYVWGNRRIPTMVEQHQNTIAVGPRSIGKKHC
jgi:hypothetical protein